MTETLKTRWVFVLSFLFVAVNAYCFFINNYYLNFLPFVLLIFVLALFAMDKLMLLMVFFTPLSLTFEKLLNKHVSADMSVPTEPVLFGIMFIFILKMLLGQKIDKKLLRHPVTIAIFINLLWISITTLTSTMPIISVKFLISRLWFIIPFYFLGTQLFKNINSIKAFQWLYIIPFIGIIFYTIIHHSQFGFDEETANWVMSPFYNDHTAYGAALAMFFPVIITFCFDKEYSIPVKATAITFTAIFCVAIVLSYARATWVSLTGALIVFMLMLLRVKYKYLLMALGVVIIGVLFNWDQIAMKLEKNNQDASDDFKEHIESISNISSDASNLERLNRWNCAFRMFNERPFFGWGPGTYSFQYAPFQKANEKTIISTNMGDGGNAHSEYIGPLAESGVLGTLTFLGIMFVSLGTGFKVFYKAKSRKIKLITGSVLLGLITYFVHGFLNNFLDTDKASVPFWAFIAILVAVDLYHEEQPQSTPEKEVLAD